MITLHGKCQCCGRNIDSIEVEIPHATIEQRRKVGVTGLGMMATAICRGCVEVMVAAWARHGAAEWAKTRAEWEAAHRAQDTDPAEAP